MRQSLTFAISALLFAASSWAATSADALAQDSNGQAEVQVDGTRHPELKPYRVMSAGLDAFEQHRSLAPNASLRFKLRQLDVPIGEAQKWDGVALRIAGDQLSIPLPISADGTFVLPRSQAAYDEDADLVLNRKKSTIGFLSMVRSPALPDNVARLGDLRLQCQVTVAIGKKELNFAQRAFYNTVSLGGDWCYAKRLKFGWVLNDWPISVTIEDKGTQRILRANGYRLVAPIEDKSLSDDALISLESWSRASEERKREFLASTPLFLKSSVDKWGAGVPFREVEKGRFVARMALSRGESKVRLESADGLLALGGPVQDAKAGIGTVPGLRYHGGRLVIHADQPDTFEFALDLRDPDHPSMTIRRTES